jgi:hypothetical protein
MSSRTELDTLAERVFVMACDVEKRRLSGQYVRLVVRGALLAELSLRGCLVEDGSTVRPSPTKRTGDPLLDDALRAMSEQRPRSWRGWVRRDTNQTVAAVRAKLASAGVIGVEPTRVLGIFPRVRITVADPARVSALRSSVLELVRGNRPVSEVSTQDAMLVSLVATGELNAVLSRHDRRAYADRIKEFDRRGGDTAPALRHVIRSIKAARAAAASNASGG